MQSAKRVKETKRQGRIAHHHTDATVPHIVALLGLSFHAANIRCFPLTSKYFYSFFTFLHHFLSSFRNISYLCPVFTSEVEAKSRSGWVGPNLEESVILRFVF